MWKPGFETTGVRTAADICPGPIALQADYPGIPLPVLPDRPADKSAVYPIGAIKVSTCRDKRHAYGKAGKRPRQNSKAVGWGLSANDFAFVPSYAHFPGKAPRVVGPAVGEGPTPCVVPLMRRDQSRRSDPRPSKRCGAFLGQEMSALYGVSALEPVSPAHNTLSGPSRRGYSTIRTCSRLRRHCSARLCGAAARSLRRGGHSVLPRTLRATPVMSSSQGRWLDRLPQQT